MRALAIIALFSSTAHAAQGTPVSGVEFLPQASSPVLGGDSGLWRASGSRLRWRRPNATDANLDMMTATASAAGPSHASPLRLYSATLLPQSSAPSGCLGKVCLWLSAGGVLQLHTADNTNTSIGLQSLAGGGSPSHYSPRYAALIFRPQDVSPIRTGSDGLWLDASDGLLKEQSASGAQFRVACVPGCALARCDYTATGCAAPADADGDGLNDAWESAGGIDNDCNGAVDGSDASLPNANTKVKDVYIQIAYMGQSTFTYDVVDQTTCIENFTFSEPAAGHKPLQSSVDAVVAAFSGSHLDYARCGSGYPACAGSTACVDGACLPTCTSDGDCTNSFCVDQDGGGSKVCRRWRLHVDALPVSGVTHKEIVQFGNLGDACAGTSDRVDFYTIKTALFNPNEAPFKHFVLFAHDSTCSDSLSCASCPVVEGAQPAPGRTGISEIIGNDCIVSLNTFAIDDPDNLRLLKEAGTLMRELGRNFGLGQFSRANETVNYLSVMGFAPYQFDGVPFTDTAGSNTRVGARPDYAHQTMSTLNEANLNEVDGVRGSGLSLHPKDLLTYIGYDTPAQPCPIDPCTGFPAEACAKYASTALVGGVITPVDWNGDGDATDVGLAFDLDGDGPLEIQGGGVDDWSAINSTFQCSANAGD